MKILLEEKHFFDSIFSVHINLLNDNSEMKMLR